MIVFVELSSRRYMVLDVDPTSAAWHCGLSSDGPKGFTHASMPWVVLRKGSWQQAVNAALDFERARGGLVTHDEWRKAK